ncbi:hypothetical protein [Sphingomonas sp.]|uniref:hypothetical protein n=1 Tax=Sphingomonas sp. TaxID=28214 RepID=UPI002B5A3772|nr:hypothetical protein [Sphingomonas sp.]HTG38719.1 hypothetical protein [Sphingomonas sp.]
MRIDAFPATAGTPGFRLAYHIGESNHCPGCTRSHWLVGRMTAECAYCGTALPIRTGRMSGTGLFRSHGAKGVPLAA